MCTAMIRNCVIFSLLILGAVMVARRSCFQRLPSQMLPAKHIPTKSLVCYRDFGNSAKKKNRHLGDYGP